MSMSRLKSTSREAAAVAANEGGQFKKVEELKNGEYRCFVHAAELKELPMGDVLAIKLHVEISPTQSITIDWDTWLTNVDGSIAVVKQPTVGYLRSQFKTLGFEESHWEPDLFWDRLEQSLPFLRGMVFQCRKTSKSGDNGKMFHNLYVKSRLQDSQPAKVTLAMLGEVLPAGLNEGTAPPAQQQPANAGATAADIPFALAIGMISTLATMV